MREARVRNLQSANERLQAELEATKILLRQVASGPEHMRSLVLELLDNAKEPLEILHVLKNTEGMDFVIPKIERGENGEFDSQKPEERLLIERAGGSALPSAPVVPTQESYGTSRIPMQPGALLPDTEYYNMSDSITADSAFGHPSMLYAPLYNSSSGGTGDVPGYTAVSKQPISRELRVLMLQPVIDREFQSDHSPTLRGPGADTCTNVHRDSTNPRPKGPRASGEQKSLL